MRSARPYPVPENEQQRLKALNNYQILDTVPEEEYNRITKIAAGICGVPASMMTLLDDKRQWFKSSFGFDIKETPREFAFCNYTIMDPEKVTVIEDLRTDQRFATNPLVQNDPHAVFYAGAPLVTHEGYVLGSICVLDNKTNKLTDNQKEALAALSQQVMNSLELRKKIRELKQTQVKLKRSNKDLKDFARIVSHDIKTPVANISMLSGAVQNASGALPPEDSREIISLINKSSKALLNFIDDVLRESSKTGNRKSLGLTDPNTVLSEIKEILGLSDHISIIIKSKLPKLSIDKSSLHQVLQNLLTNAIKYNDKEQVVINIACITHDGYHTFLISDNGSGIAPQDLRKLFKRRQTLGKKDRYGNNGTGFGLHAVKNIVTSFGGKIAVASQEKIGTEFRISFPSSFN